MSNNFNFSVIYFSAFTPKILESRVKNNFINNKNLKNTLNNLNTNNICVKRFKVLSSRTLKPHLCKTTCNTPKNYISNKNVSAFRDCITLQSNDNINIKKGKKKSRNKHGIGRTGALEPYKQYIIEKRELEENRKRREIEKKYIIESKKQQELKLMNDIKTKYEGYDFSRQEAKVGFLDKYIESKNYSKEKIKDFFGRTQINTRKNNFQYLNMYILEDIKSNKKKNIFDEDFDLKSSTKYYAFRLKAVSFIKSLRHNPNYNYWIRKDH